jgi:hypothetical protein
MNETHLHIYCNGHHARMLGIQRADAPKTLRNIWLDGWDSADGELYDRAITNSRKAAIRALAKKVAG